MGYIYCSSRLTSYKDYIGEIKLYHHERWGNICLFHLNIYYLIIYHLLFIPPKGG